MRSNLLAAAALVLLAAPAAAQNDAISLKGMIDIHVHQGPDSAPRAIDADDVARQAKAAGMRAVVLKNHWEDTASLAYMVRKMVGTLVDVGRGKLTPDDIPALFALRDRSKSGPTVPPQGLCMAGVAYESSVERAGDADTHSATSQ